MLTPRQLCERVVGSIESALATPAIAGEWRRSRLAFESFPGGWDAGEVEHHGFAVGLPSTDPLGDRQHVAVGALSWTQVFVRWAHRLRVEGVAFDHDEALDAEVELVKAVIGTEPNPQLKPVFLGTTRSSVRAGQVFIGETRFRVHHHYPLQ